ncbi:MAG: hypothetical protein HY649_00395 [Acidobacteria bacterium]|nr:hypothetical protein [Acidobacteriota bacterium]
MMRITRDCSLTEKVCVLAAILLLGLPMLAAGQEKGQGFGEDSEGADLVTMPGMRSMVPSLVGLGWDNFFLNNRFGLSSDQIQKLISIREAFLVENRLAEQAAREAELLLYEELGRDQVSSRRLEDRIDSRATLQGKVLSLRFRYLLRAINVLNHEQHQKIVAFLKSGTSPMSSQQSRRFPGSGRWRTGEILLLWDHWIASKRTANGPHGPISDTVKVAGGRSSIGKFGNYTPKASSPHLAPRLLLF